MAIQLNSTGWRIRPARLARGRGGDGGDDLPGLPREFLTANSSVADEAVLEPAPATRGRDRGQEPLDLGYDVGPGESAVLAIRHRSGALTFHPPLQTTVRGARRGTDLRFRVAIPPQPATRGIGGAAIKAIIVKVGRLATDKREREGRRTGPARPAARLRPSARPVAVTVALESEPELRIEAREEAAMKRKTTKRASTKKKGRKKAPARRRATARPKRKAARTARRVKRKAVRRKPATARRRKAKGAKPSRSAATRRKPRRAAKRAKPAARKRATTTKPKRATATKPKPRQVARKRPTPRPAPVRAAKAAPRPVRPPEPVGRTRELNFAPSPPGRAEALIPHVEDELRRRGEEVPDPEVVNALATAGAGYREGPAADPPFDIPVDLDARVAEGFVERYWVGEHSPGPERRDHEMPARQTIRFNLDQVGPPGVSAGTVDTLAAVALGTWRPGLDPLAQLNVYANLVAGWYRAGAT